MSLSFRAKLIGIAGTATAAFVILAVMGTVTSREIYGQLSTIRDRYVPRAALGPELERELEGISRGMQDAVAAQDSEALANTTTRRDAFHAKLRAARQAVDPASARDLHQAVDDYFRSSLAVSRRLIANETGEALVDAISEMQAKQARTHDLVERATAFEQGELADAISRVTRAQERATNARLFTSVVCLVLVILMSLALSRGLLRSLAHVTDGLDRFGRGELRHRIRVDTSPELAAVARQANDMAASLERLGAERDHVDWIKSGVTELTIELRGELTSAEVATRAVRFLAHVLEAPAGILYAVEAGGVLRPLGTFAGPEGEARSFALGEGLVGQAAMQSSLTVITEPPADYLKIRSGLGEGPPRAIALMPLWQAGKVIGVIELASFQPWSVRATELLESVSELLAVSIEVARGREGLAALLTETQALARRLAAREADLKSINDELQAQHEELRQTNEELAQQARILEEQRAILQERNTELTDARTRLEDKAAELATVSAYKSQFLANMSHELRTPLNSMLLLSNMLAENASGNLTAKQVEYCRTIDQAGRDLLALINQVLDLAKIEAGKQDVRPGPVVIADLADRVSRVFGPLARDKGLALSVAHSPDLPESITTDEQKLVQIVTNLVGNAIKFTERGRVTVRIDRPAPGTTLTRPELAVDATLEIAVQDSGPGVAKGDAGRIFAPFEQVESSSSRRHGGTGLGLSIARELARLLGGDLTMTSVLGEGTTFRCHVPFVHQAGATITSPPAVLLTLPRAPAPLRVLDPPADDRDALEPGDPFLLVIKDDPGFARGLVDVIREQGLACVVATDGASGLRIARERRPTGIILDVLLPDVDGWSVMEGLRANAETAGIPVHFVSAVEGSERGKRMGAIGYLVKPATRAELARVVNRLAPRRSKDAGPILVIDANPEASASMVQWLALEGFEARAVHGGRDALEALAETAFGCVVLDPDLPDLGGRALLEAMRERFGSSHPPVIVHIARAIGREEAQALESHAVAVVLQEGSSTARLLDEIRLFVRRLAEGLRSPGGPRAHSSDQRLSGKKVLVVDDDMRTVYALSALLRAKGAAVEVADNGRAALDALRAHPDVQAVLMDMMMPEMDGYTAIGRIREDARFQRLPVIALTAKAMKGDESKCLEAGASAYLSKPIDTDRLLDLLDHHLGGSPSRVE